MTPAQETKREQKNRLLIAKIAVALRDELGRVPKENETNQVFLLTRVMYKAVLGLPFKQKEQKKQGQLVIFFTGNQDLCSAPEMICGSMIAATARRPTLA